MWSPHFRWWRWFRRLSNPRDLRYGSAYHCFPIATIRLCNAVGAKPDPRVHLGNTTFVGLARNFIHSCWQTHQAYSISYALKGCGLKRRNRKGIQRMQKSSHSSSHSRASRLWTPFVHVRRCFRCDMVEYSYPCFSRRLVSNPSQSKAPVSFDSLWCIQRTPLRLSTLENKAYTIVSTVNRMHQVLSSNETFDIFTDQDNLIL